MILIILSVKKWQFPSQWMEINFELNKLHSSTLYDMIKNMQNLRQFLPCFSVKCPETSPHGRQEIWSGLTGPMCRHTDGLKKKTAQGWSVGRRDNRKQNDSVAQKHRGHNKLHYTPVHKLTQVVQSEILVSLGKISNLAHAENFPVNMKDRSLV